jgi:hypothetical protein
MTSSFLVMTSISNVMTRNSNLMTSNLNVMTSTGHKTANQAWSWTGHDQLVILFTRPPLFLDTFSIEITQHL